MGSSDLKIGNKTARFQFYTSKRFKQIFLQQLAWRLKRDSANPSKKIPFKNQNDFFETNFKAIFLMSKFDYNFWMMRHNPYHPDFPEEKLE